MQLLDIENQLTKEFLFREFICLLYFSIFCYIYFKRFLDFLVSIFRYEFHYTVYFSWYFLILTNYEFDLCLACFCGLCRYCSVNDFNLFMLNREENATNISFQRSFVIQEPRICKLSYGVFLLEWKLRTKFFTALCNISNIVETFTTWSITKN